jgi:hypothetical protein
MTDHWAEDSQFPVIIWQSEVVNGDTRLGYADWVTGRRTADQDDRGRTAKALADEIIGALDASYDLVFVNYDDQLTDKQADLIVRGDTDTLWESTAEWESLNRYESCKTIIAEAAHDIVRRWEREDDQDYDELLTEFEYSDQWDRVRGVLTERDSGSWVQELIGHTPNVLLRINVLDEDHGYSFRDVQPEEVLTDVNLPVTEENKTIMADTLAECSPEYSVLLGYWIVSADVGDMYDLPVDDREVEIINPHLYLGNPFTGSGFISEKPFEGTVRVKRGDLHTDKGAFGHSVNEIYGGLDASSFTAEIRLVDRLSDKQAMDAIAAFVNQPGPVNGGDLCAEVEKILPQTGRPILNDDGEPLT